MSETKVSKKARSKKAFPIINPNVAGIDIGNTEICVAIDAEKSNDHVRTFGTFTCDYHEIVAHLQHHGITSVAMECTGVFWVQLYVILERSGIHSVVANARYVKNVSGRKDDENDAMWLQRLHSCGLIKGSFQLDGPTRELRDLMRNRKKIIGDQNRCLNRLIKALVLMNVKVQNVISDIDGKTGRKIVAAIIDGERDAYKLAKLADPRIKASHDELVKSLQGDWNENQLFLLTQQYAHYNYLAGMVHELDLQIEKQLKVILASHKNEEQITIDTDQKRKRSTSKSALPFNATAYLKAILGTDLTAIPGINETSALAFIAEVGTDMTKFESARHLKSWLNIVPVTEVTGGKIQKEKMKRRFHHAGQALRVAANTVRRSNTPLGHVFRKNLARGGPSKAILAVADKMATSIYHMVIKREPFSMEQMNQRTQIDLQRQIQKLEKKIKNLQSKPGDEVVI
jgi:transposase